MQKNTPPLGQPRCGTRQDGPNDAGELRRAKPFIDAELRLHRRSKVACRADNPTRRRRAVHGVDLGDLLGRLPIDKGKPEKRLIARPQASHAPPHGIANGLRVPPVHPLRFEIRKIRLRAKERLFKGQLPDGAPTQVESSPRRRHAHPMFDRTASAILAHTRAGARSVDKKMHAEFLEELVTCEPGVDTVVNSDGDLTEDAVEDRNRSRHVRQKRKDQEKIAHVAIGERGDRIGLPTHLAREKARKRRPVDGKLGPLCKDGPHPRVERRTLR